MNNVSLIGRFTNDPELRYTGSGKAVGNFTLAVRNPFDPDNADFIPCVVWNTVAELVAEKHVKGDMIGIDGRIQTRNYENSEGKTIYVVEVNVNSVHFLPSKSYFENNGNGNGNGNANGNGKSNNSSTNRNRSNSNNSNRRNKTANK